MPPRCVPVPRAGLPRERRQSVQRIRVCCTHAPCSAAACAMLVCWSTQTSQRSWTQHGMLQRKHTMLQRSTPCCNASTACCNASTPCCNASTAWLENRAACRNSAAWIRPVFPSDCRGGRGPCAADERHRLRKHECRQYDRCTVLSRHRRSALSPPIAYAAAPPRSRAHLYVDLHTPVPMQMWPGCSYAVRRARQRGALS